MSKKKAFSKFTILGWAAFIAMLGCMCPWAVDWTPLPPEHQFSTFSSNGTHKQISKIWQSTENYMIFFAYLTKIIGIILIQSHGVAIVLAIIIVKNLTI